MYKHFIHSGLRFVVRATGKRNLIHKGEKRHTSEVVKYCPMKSEFEVKIERDGYEEVKKISIGEEMVSLLSCPNTLLKLIMIRGFGEEPILLLTNVLDEDLKEMLDIYLTRWKIEESYRFLKQAYNLEDIRIRGWIGLRNMMVLLLAVFYFISIELGRKLKLNILLQKIYKKAKRFFRIPLFKHYAIADGIYTILFPSKGIDKIIPKISIQDHIPLLPFQDP